MVPELVAPHAFAALVQEFPYPLGFAGVVALQVPLQVLVPELVWPHVLAALVHAFP